MRKILLCFSALMFLFFTSCEKKGGDEPSVPIKVEFITPSIETDANELPLMFRVTPADAKIEIRGLDLIGSIPNSSSTSDPDYMSIADPTARHLAIESLDNVGNGSYILHTKFYFNDKPIVMKDEHMYSFTCSNVSFELTTGEQSNTMKVALKRGFQK